MAGTRSGSSAGGRCGTTASPSKRPRSTGTPMLARSAAAQTRRTGGRSFTQTTAMQTGSVRGALCSNCNLGLGNFQDDIEVLRKAIKYLERSGCQMS
ncbi:endonuclease domain-containing protein [Mycobacterium intracellulare]|uniref:endonuclease domain-containing protein n=1 Tax=Mycobacterium intracellulare TaxID=1767 RepID=UPI0037CC7DC2